MIQKNKQSRDLIFQENDPDENASLSTRIFVPPVIPPRKENTSPLSKPWLPTTEIDDVISCLVLTLTYLWSLHKKGETLFNCFNLAFASG